MGSTGHGLYSKGAGKTDSETFGIAGAVRYKGSIPAGSGLEPVGANKITLKVPATDGNNILFQFKLTKDSKSMIILGYKNGVPEIKCKVSVDSGQPSLDRLMATTTSASVKAQAVKMKDLFSKSTKIKENQLGSIADTLLKKKQMREGNR